MIVHYIMFGCLGVIYFSVYIFCTVTPLLNILCVPLYHTFLPMVHVPMLFLYIYNIIKDKIATRL